MHRFDAPRNSYNSQVSIGNVPSKFQNKADEIPFYGNDYSAKNVVLSVNDYSDRDVNFDTTKDTGLSSDFEILDISTTGVLVKNDKKLRLGKKTKISLKFDDVDITLNAKVVKIEGNSAGLEFIDMPQDVANKILFRYMQQADSMKSNLTSSSL